MSKPQSAANDKPVFASKTEEFQAKIKEAFNLYENEGMIEAEELAHTVHFMNLNPTQRQIKKMKEEFGDDFIPYEKFEPVMMNILITNTYDDELMLRDNEETIAKAFEILDKEKKGYLETDNLVRLLKTYGEPMDDDEIREFLHAAEDPATHQIRYEEYAHILSSE